MISLSDAVENIVEKGENAGYQHFLLFHAMFSKAFYFRVIKSRDCMVRVNIPFITRCINPFPNDKFCTLLYILKEFADNNFNFDENGRKLSKWVENTVGKEKLLVTSNFAFSHSVFKRHALQTRKNQGLFWERVNFS